MLFIFAILNVSAINPFLLCVAVLGVCLCVLPFCVMQILCSIALCVCDYHRGCIIYCIVIGLCCVYMYTNPFLPTGKSGILLLHEAKFLLSILSTNLMSQTLLKVFVPKALIINLISYNFGSNKIVLVN